MEQWLERMLLICLIIAMGNLIFRLAKNQIQNPFMERIRAVTMGIGFMLGTILGFLKAPNGFSVETGLCLLGAMLSYMAVLFTIPVKKGEMADE